ncbi:MAG TPA: glutamate racemase [Porphyromonadaceae bacterium]|nr:glutamate racemase [Porphyromonadaceae bacterium]
MKDFPVSPIGIFDSGYGGLSVFREIKKLLPQSDYLYLGDNAHVPYGGRSFDMVYKFTWEAVQYLFQQNCMLVIVACNTASAKALRSIQQKNLPKMGNPLARVLGVIRPTAEKVGKITRTKHIGILGTEGTIASESYTMEIKKLFPEIKVVGHACPMWVPLVECGEYDAEGADYYVKKDIEEIMEKDSQIDTLILACTHYPLLLSKIKKYTPQGVTIISQGEWVAKSLENYLYRHPEIEGLCSKGGTTCFCTTDAGKDFKSHASIFLGSEIEEVRHIVLG